eukprot:TRINITY_DN6047_c0_g1_i1.p1 TRINITY_DN6047_c0_g1~~TRINITY_DN6047_c0_g1_i1.p1  ORF type:complete len:671 (+),score=97.52 TRINITY_DN6047_c0_g1_i1:27-2015(+)
MTHPEQATATLKLLFNLTRTYLQEHPSQIQAIWRVVSRRRCNIAPTLDFLLTQGTINDEKEVNEVQYLVKTIVTFLAHSKSSKINVVTGLLTVFTPETWKKSEQRALLALCFLSELIHSCKTEVVTDLYSYLPVLLHQIFLGLDYKKANCHLLIGNILFSPASSEPSNLVLVSSSEGIATSSFDGHSSNGSVTSEGRKKVAALDHLSPDERDRNELIKQVARELSFPKESSKHFDLVSAWADEALGWALACPELHLYHHANRSYEVFRALQPTLLLKDFGRIISSYAAFLSSPPPSDLSPTAMRASEKFQRNITFMLIDLLPLMQIDTLEMCYYTATALLLTDLEEEFADSIVLLEHLLDILLSRDEREVLSFIKFTNSWDLELSALVCRGLLCKETEERTLVVLVKLGTLYAQAHVDRKKMLAIVLGLTPWLVSELRTSGKSRNAKQASKMLASLCSRYSIKSLFASYAGKHSFTQDSFSVAFAKGLADGFMPKYQPYIFSYFFEQLQVSEFSYEPELRMIVCGLLPYSSPSKEEGEEPWVGAISRFIQSTSWETADFSPLCKCIENELTNEKEVRLSSFKFNHPGFPNDAGKGLTFKWIKTILATIKERSLLSSNEIISTPSMTLREQEQKEKEAQNFEEEEDSSDSDCYYMSDSGDSDD